MPYARTVHHEAPQDALRLAEAALAAEEAAWARGRSELASARLAEVLAEAGADAEHPRHAAALAAYERFWEPYTYSDPLVRPLWESLRESGIKVGVLSNTIWTRDYHRAIFERDGVLDLIDGDVYSSEIPWAKPHSAAFAAAADAVGEPVERCVYVGDRIFEDVHGAQQAGMLAILVPHSDIPVGQQMPVQAEPDAVVQSLAEVAGVVAGWNA